MTEKLDAEQRIKRTQIKLWENKPFWAYLSYYLKFHETPNDQLKYATMCVDLDGNIYYSKKFVDELTDQELMGVIAHELAHLIFISHQRQGSKNPDGWNISTDLANNSILIRDNFVLPKGVLIPDHNDEIACGFGKKIEKISEKTAEEIYEELPKLTIDKDGNIFVEGHGNNKGKKEKIGKMIDGHIVGKGNKKTKDGKDENALEGLSENEKRDIETKWKERMIEAHTIAKMKGNVPAGIERLIDKLHEEKINWRVLLNKYIVNAIPSDYTYRTPHKKSVSISSYLPDEVKEQIDVAVAIDTSGSISEKDLADFLSEIFGIARAFNENISMTLIPCDCEVQETYTIENGGIERIKEEVKIKGGGGTEFQPVIDWINENKRDTKILVYLTDGYGSKIKKPDFDILWV